MLCSDERVLSSVKEDDEAVQHDGNQVLKGLVCQVNSEVYLGSKEEMFKHRVGVTEFKLERSLWKPGERKTKGGDWRQEC